jgi:hypothetical protein
VEIVSDVNQSDVPSANQLSASLGRKLLEALGIANKSRNRFLWRRCIILLNALCVVTKANNYCVKMLGVLSVHSVVREVA